MEEQSEGQLVDGVLGRHLSTLHNQHVCGLRAVSQRRSLLYLFLNHFFLRKEIHSHSGLLGGLVRNCLHDMTWSVLVHGRRGDTCVCPWSSDLRWTY